MNYFDDILVIVNFNHPYYANIPFIKNVLYKNCPNIVFYGDSASEQSHPDVSVVPQCLGAFAYRVMTDAVKKYPGYSGYLFVMDDMFLNIENLRGKDKKKIWFPKPDPSNFLNVFGPHRGEREWNVASWLTQNRSAWKKLPGKYTAFLQRTLGVENGFAQAVSDCFYLPAGLSAEWIEVADVFSAESVYLETAIPTILCAIQDHRQWDHLDIKYLWGFFKRVEQLGDRARWRSFLSNELDGLHPVKFSDIRNRNTIIWMLAEVNKKGMLLAYKSKAGIKELLIRMYYDFVGLTSCCNISYWLLKSMNFFRGVKSKISGILLEIAK